MIQDFQTSRERARKNKRDTECVFLLMYTFFTAKSMTCSPLLSFFVFLLSLFHPSFFHFFLPSSFPPFLPCFLYPSSFTSILHSFFSSYLPFLLSSFHRSTPSPFFLLSTLLSYIHLLLSILRSFLHSEISSSFLKPLVQLPVGIGRKPSLI